MDTLSTKQILSLQNNELFCDSSDEFIHQIINDHSVITLTGGDTLIHAGDHNHNLYLILSGRLRIHLATDRTNPVAVLKTGQSVGEISIIDKQPASANVIADCDCELLIIEEEEIWQLFDTSHAIANNMLRLLTKRLRHGNSMFTKIRELMREYEYSAMVDPLTNLYNRRWLDDMLPRIMQRCQSNQQSLGVAMLDIDYFKQFNDQHGHLAGDCALRTLSNTINQSVRPEDFVTRYGGEEFFVLLPNQDLNATQQIAERLRKSVSETTISQQNGKKLPGLTASIGICEMNSSDSANRLIETADKALYRAKHAGRDQVSQ